MLDERSRRQAGKPSRLSKRQTVFSVQRYGEPESDARLGEERLVVKMEQNRFRLMPVKDDDRMFSRRAQGNRWIVLQVANTESSHGSPNW